MTQRFKKTVDVLSREYLAGNLVKTDCTKCAVGNMVRAGGESPIAWSSRFGRRLASPVRGGMLTGDSGFYSFHLTKDAEYRNPIDKAMNEFEATGYTPEECIMVEHLFMGKDAMEIIDNSMESQFDGLMRVIDYLAELDGISLTTTKKAKNKFQKELV